MNPRGAFVVPIHDLDAEGRSFRAPIAADWLREVLSGAEMQPAGPDGQLEVHLCKMGQDVLIRGKTLVELVVPCARCLDPVALHCDLEMSLLLAPKAPTKPAILPHRARARAGRRGGDSAAAPSAAAPSSTPGGSDAGRGARARPIPGEEHEFTSEEADQDTYEGEEVDLDRFVREAILLESPIFPLCSDACRGIGPPPSSPLSNGGSKAGAIDPRLLPLVELARKRSSKE
jgi:uncharacterized protein